MENKFSSEAPKVLSMDEQIKEAIKKVTISKQAKRVLEERLKLKQEYDEANTEYFTAISEMICPKCGQTTIREKTTKLAFDKDHKRKDLIRETIKCTAEDCDFVFDIPEPKIK